MSAPRSSPPAAAVWMLSRLLPRQDRDAFLGDLEEAFRAEVVPARGPAAARRWYWLQAMRAPLTLARARQPHVASTPERGRPHDATRSTTCGSPCAFWRGVPASPRSRCSRLPSALARPPRSTAPCIRSSSRHCRIPMRTAFTWCMSGKRRRMRRRSSDGRRTRTSCATRSRSPPWPPWARATRR